MNIKDKLQIGMLVHVHGNARNDGVDYEGEAVFLSTNSDGDCWVWHHNQGESDVPCPRYASYGPGMLLAKAKEAFIKLTGRQPDGCDVFSAPFYKVGKGTGWITKIIGYYNNSTASGKDPYGVGPEGETAAYFARGGGLKWL